MAEITLYNDRPTAATYVPNSFIDKYMVHANGDYVKVFLYLLRCISSPEGNACRCSISHMADYFDYTEKDIARALKYWEKMNLLRLEYDGKNNLAGICLLSAGEAGQHASGKTDLPPETQEETPADEPQASPKPQVSQSGKEHRMQLQELIFVIEKYLGRTLTSTDLDMIFSWHDELCLSPELIEFLVEKCVEKQHSSLYYMNRIAQEWSTLHISSVEEAKKTIARNNSTYHAVMKAFGIRGRVLNPDELQYLKKWSALQGFDDDMIALACSRTIQCIHEPSFAYADSILGNWFKQNIHHTSDVEKADLAYQQSHGRGTSRKNTAPAEGTKSTRFSNFNQRDYDYQELEQQLLAQSIQQS